MLSVASLGKTSYTRSDDDGIMIKIERAGDKTQESVNGVTIFTKHDVQFQNALHRLFDQNNLFHLTSQTG